MTANESTTVADAITRDIDTVINYAVLTNDQTLLSQCLATIDASKMLNIMDYNSNGSYIYTCATPAIMDLMIAKLDKINAKYAKIMSGATYCACINDNIALADHLWTTYPECKNVKAYAWMCTKNSLDWAINHGLVEAASMPFIRYVKLVRLYAKTEPDFLKSIAQYFEAPHIDENSDLSIYFDSYMWILDNISTFDTSKLLDDFSNAYIHHDDYFGRGTIAKIDELVRRYLTPNVTLFKLYLETANNSHLEYIQLALRRACYDDMKFAITEDGIRYITSSVDLSKQWVDHYTSNKNIPIIFSSFINGTWMYTAASGAGLMTVINIVAA